MKTSMCLIFCRTLPPIIQLKLITQPYFIFHCEKKGKDKEKELLEYMNWEQWQEWGLLGSRNPLWAEQLLEDFSALGFI